MRSLISRLKGLTELLLLTVLLMVGLGGNEAFAQWFSSPGGGSGGFTGRPLITVEISADKTRVPVNLAGQPPNPSLPYTSTITAVVRRDGRLFPTNIQFDLAPTLASGALFDPEDLTQGFRSLPLESTSGLATVFFHASSTPGEVVITASAQDPDTGQTVSASLKITVVDEPRPPAAITFTGAYVNAVIAGESRFGGAETPIQDGSYSRVISVVVNDTNGNPTNPNTQINFFLVDGPITGYPSTPGSFFIAGGNGNPVDGQFQFNAVGGDFIIKGVTPFQRLVLGKPIPDLRIIDSVLSATSLTVQSSSRSPFPANTSNVPYVIGSAQNAAVLSPSFTNLQGVASTILTYPVERIGQTAVLVACTADMSVCGTLNTCDVNGANCKSVYLGVTNGTDRTLTVSATSLGPNRTTDVQMCLRDVNFTPLPATEIRYDIGLRGTAKVTVNGVEGTPGKILTGENGCTVAQIASSGQIPGSLPIPLQFTSDYVATPANIEIRSPGAGKMDGFFNCEFNANEGTGQCNGTLRLTDDEGSPMADVLIVLGQVVAPGEFTVTFNPAESVFGKTDATGQLQVSVEMKSPGAYTFPFQTASGGTATYTLNATVPAPGTLTVALNGPTEALLKLPYSAVLQATGGVPPYVWTLTSGSLPPGLSLSGTGAISGTPTQEGAFSFAVQVKDKNDLTGFGAFTITVGKQPDLTLTLAPTQGPVDAPFNGVVSATGGTEPYSFALLAGSLPPGLTLSSNGTLSGKPTAVGTFAFSVKATDSKGATGTGNFSLTIASNLPLTVTLQGNTGTVGVDFNGLLTATGGAAPYTFRVSAGSLPDGLNLFPNGTITGKPTKAGVFVAQIEASDKNGLKGSSTITITITGTGGGGSGLVSSVLLLSSNPTLDSSGKNPVTLTAIVKDSNSNTMADVPVTFAVTNGANAIVQVVTGTTDASGTATAQLNTGGDPTSRTIVLTATAGGVSSSPVSVNVAGTQLTIAGPTTAVLGGASIPLTLTLVDSAGQPLANQSLTVATAPAGLVTPTTATTNSGGQAQVTVTPTSTTLCPPPAAPAPPTTPCIVVTATGAGATGSLTITVSPDNFVFVTPLPAPAQLVSGEWNVPLNTPQTLRVRWLTGALPGTPVVGQPVTFSATRGTLGGANPVNTDANGEATIQIQSNNAGFSTITATAAGPSAQLTVLFVSTNPTQMTLQAVPTTIGANPAGSSGQQSTITATVRDNNDNPVANRAVNFSVNDVSGGVISPSTAVTNTSGQASTVYTAGQTPGAKNGVRVDAAVSGVGSIRCPGQQAVSIGPGVPGQLPGPGPFAFCSVSLTVAQQELFIKLGTGNKIEELDDTRYKQPWSVLVTDANGGPVPGAAVTLSILPTVYWKGTYNLGICGILECWVWTPSTAEPCANEDTNRNGILDSGPPDEDVNGNDRLDPGNVATFASSGTVSSSVTVGSDGFGLFDVIYAQQYANWVAVELRATVKVAGSESLAVESYNLPILASVIFDVKADPPGRPSPFGVNGCGDPD